MNNMEELKKLIKENNFKIRVVNTYTGFNWDNPQSKVFALLVGNTRLNPHYLNSLGFNAFYKKTSADKGLFYNNALGMSRSFNIVYNLSSWLFHDGYKIKEL